MRKSVLFIAFGFASCFAIADNAKLGIYVEDEVSNAPLQNVNVIASFEDDIGWRAWTDSPKPVIARGVTDENGICRLSGKTNCGRSSIWVEQAPNGYYKSRHGGHVKYESRSLFGTWQPENIVITVALQRVEHPIPLCVRFVEKRNDKGRLGGFDGTNAVLQYDFIKGDWLPPEGEGTYADMTIRTHYDLREIVTNSVSVLYFYDFTNEIEFSGAGNGLYEESFKDKNCGIKIRVAPEDGYVSSKTLRFGSKKNIFGKGGVNMFMKYYKDSDEDRCYCFRIRSKFNNEGELTEAYYGKIYGDFNFKGHMQTGFDGVQFLYYLNPKPLDRNLEWDMKNNMANENAKSRRQRFYGEP